MKGFVFGVLLLSSAPASAEMLKVHGNSGVALVCRSLSDLRIELELAKVGKSTKDVHCWNVDNGKDVVSLESMDGWSYVAVDDGVGGMAKVWTLSAWLTTATASKFESDVMKRAEELRKQLEAAPKK
jgi:hypothetical protein